MKIGWLVAPRFSIILHERDKPLLEQIKNFFGVGCIIKSGSKSIQFQVVPVKDFRVIIDHFDKYPLITEKCSNFKLFKKSFQFIKNKEHLTEKGLLKIVAIKGSMNWGL